MKDAERRLQALEAENRDLKAEVGALRLLLTPAKPAVPRRDEPQVRIMTPPLVRVALPSKDEFQRLLHVVLDRYPILRPRDETEDFRAQFRAAFIRLAHCGRRDMVDNERSLSWWCDDAQEWCRRHQVNPTWIGGAVFTAAAIAHGDIRYVMDDWPHDTAFGLQFGGGGYEPKDWWRRALAGTLLPPTPSPYPKPRSSPARVRQEIS